MSSRGNWGFVDSEQNQSTSLDDCFQMQCKLHLCYNSISNPIQRCIPLLAVQVNFSSWEIWKFQLNLWPSVENVKTVLCFKLNSVLRYWGPERIDAGHTYYRQAWVTYGPVFFAACNGAIDLLGKLYFLSGTNLLRSGFRALSHNKWQQVQEN